MLMLAGALLVVGCDEGAGGGAAQPRIEAEKPPGQLTYQRFCFSCHASGAAGAPRVGHVDAWAQRLDAKGEEGLIQSTIDGIPPGMPPRGLCMQCSDEELADAVRFMLKLSEPAG